MATDRKLSALDATTVLAVGDQFYVIDGGVSRKVDWSVVVSQLFQAVSIDEDDMASDLATKLPTQQSVRAYIAAEFGDLASVAATGAYGDLSGRPTLGTAAALDVAATGDAAVGEVVKGNDTRLTDARTPASHTHTKADISDFSEDDYAAPGDLVDFETTTQLNARDTANRARSNHTGQQAASTISDFATAADARIAASDKVSSDPTGITGADAITNIVSLTQAEYDAIGTPDAATLYVIVG